jgi:hypothetical protein
MDTSKLISLLIAALYVIAFTCLFVFDEERDAQWKGSLFRGVSGLFLWLGLSLGCIWWGDELGEGLIGAKYGLISKSSPGWAIKLMGWILLLLPAFIGLNVKQIKKCSLTL